MGQPGRTLHHLLSSRSTRCLYAPSGAANCHSQQTTSPPAVRILYLNQAPKRVPKS